MAGFILKTGKVIYQMSKPVVKEGVRQTVKNAPVVMKPVADFTRGVVKGGPKYIPIAGSQGVRQGTITVALRAGMQTRQATAYVVKAAVVKGPVTAARVIIYPAKVAIRDAMIPYKYGVYGYHVIRSERIMRGATSVVERAADRFIPWSGRYLDKMGLAPRFGGTVAGTVRIAVVGTLATGAASSADKLSEYYTYLAQTTERYKDIAVSRIRGSIPVVNVPVVEVDSPVVGVSPPYVPPVPTPVVPQPPVRQVGNRAPVVITPPARRR